MTTLIESRSGASVVEASAEDVLSSIKVVLAAAEIGEDELLSMARRGEFTSPEAERAWFLVGDLLKRETI